MSDQGAVKIVMVQFNCNMNCCLDGVPERRPTAPQKDRVQGQMVIDPTRAPVSLAQIVQDLKKVGMVLIDAFYELRPNQYGKKKVARFTFIAPDELDHMRTERVDTATVWKTIEQLCADNWGAVVYENPRFLDGKAVDGESAISINLNRREDGQRATATSLRLISHPTVGVQVTLV